MRGQSASRFRGQYIAGKKNFCMPTQGNCYRQKITKKHYIVVINRATLVLCLLAQKLIIIELVIYLISDPPPLECNIDDWTLIFSIRIDNLFIVKGDFDG